MANRKGETMPREILQERDVALLAARGPEGHHGGMIRYVFNTTGTRDHVRMEEER